MSAGGGHLSNLEIGGSVLIEEKNFQLEYDISCLGINPIGDNLINRQSTAMGLWKDIKFLGECIHGGQRMVIALNNDSLCLPGSRPPQEPPHCKPSTRLSTPVHAIFAYKP